MAEQPQKDKEKLDFLKRDEVRTMAKDIAKLRRKEAEKERKRITELKIEQTKKKKEKSKPLAMDRVHISLAPEVKTPQISVPKPLSQKQKIIIRLIIGFILVFLLINVGLFLYWYFIREDVPQTPPEQTTPITQPTPPEQTTPITQPTTPDQEKPVVPEPTPSLIPVDASISLSVATKDLLPELSQLLTEERIQGFTEIRLQNPDGSAWNASKVFEGLGITDSQNVGENLKNIMVFIYQDTEKRIGLAAKFKTPMNTSSWEKTLELDTVPLFAIIENKGIDYTRQFRSIVHQNVSIRFQTFSIKDFGIVYATTNDHFILTSSLESIIAIISILNQQ